MKELITVVVPCYNVEAFLDFTMESIVAQTYKNLEIFLINDGSTDSTGAICDKWAEKDQRIQVHHQENGGLSHARNVGISMANAKYISFIDADDYIDEDMLEVLFDLMIENDAQMSSCIWDEVYDGSISTDTKNIYTKVFSTKEAIESALRGKELSLGATNKLYELKLFDKVLFPIGLTIEDAYVMMELILQCQRVAFINKGLYHHYHREGSIMHSPFSSTEFNVIRAHQHNKEVILPIYPDLYFLVEQRLSWAYLYAYDKLIQSDCVDQELEKELRREVLRRFRFIRKGDYFNKSRIIAVYILHYSPGLYKRLVEHKAKNYIPHES